MNEIILPPPNRLIQQQVLPSTLRDEWQQIVDEEKARVVSLRGPIAAGLSTLIVGVGGFLLWAYITPMAQASAASGKVIAESYTKTVTHLEGGTLREILVKEGQKVTAGQVLAVLDVTRSLSAEVQARQQNFVSQIRMARLLAERDGQKDFAVEIEAPSGMSSAVAAQLAETEKRLFKERQSQFVDALKSAKAQIEQLEILYISLQAKQVAQREQLSFMQKDEDLLSSMASKKLATRPQLNEKKIQVWQMKGQIAETEAAMGQNRQQLAQANLTLTNLKTEHLRLISEQLQQTQAEIATLEQQIVTTADVVEKASIRSPADGVVSNIRLFAPGSAIVAGSPIMDVVPANQPLLIEARAKAMDIDSIHPGAPAEIHLSSFGADEAFPLQGKVNYVAADSVIDERSGETTYAIKIRINDGELKKQPNLFMYPGMNAEVFIVNGERTAWAYLTEPLTKSFKRAFREQ